MENVIIAEIAGKDSISAINRFIHKRIDDIYIIVPTIVYTGTEYGRIDTYNESIEYLKRVSGPNIRFDNTHVIRDEKLWNKLNAKYQYLINRKYNFYTPCIMCHFYAHLLRIPLYLEMSAVGLLTGERLSHDGKLKINQHKLVLKYFRDLFVEKDIKFIQPNLKISNTKFIDNVISDKTIIKQANDVKCIMSNNLYGFSLESPEALSYIERYMTEFFLPLGDYCITNMVKNKQVNLFELEKKIEEILNG